MCGRFALFSEPGDLARLFDVDEVRTAALPPRYNVAPTLEVYAIVDTPTGRERRLGRLRWGLVPSWSEDARGGPINARAETVHEKPSFREAFTRRRCLIPADGFYEWRVHVATGVRTPYFIHRVDGEPLAFAGLWESWSGPPGGPSEDEPLRTCAIVTTAADGWMRDLHDRMPVVLPRERWGDWLDPAQDDVGALRHLLDVEVDHALDAYAVTDAVNDARNEGGHLIEPALGGGCPT